MDPAMMAPKPKPRSSLPSAPSLAKGLVEASQLAEKSTLEDAREWRAQQMDRGEQMAAVDRAPSPMTNEGARNAEEAGIKRENRFIDTKYQIWLNSNEGGIGMRWTFPNSSFWKLEASVAGEHSLEESRAISPDQSSEDLGTAAGRVLPDHCGEFDHPPLGAPARGDPACGISVDKRGIQMYKTSPGKGKTPNKISFSLFKLLYF